MNSEAIITRPTSIPLPNVDYDVVIIGAGTSGLSVAYYLLKRGIQPLVLDSASEIGSSWRKRHPQLSLNTHRRFSGLPGRPIRKSKGIFVKRDDYIHYLEQYEAMLWQQYQCRIQFNTEVKQVKACQSGWKIVTETRCFTTPNLIIATGPDKERYLPQWPGMESFNCNNAGNKRNMLHAADFGKIEQYDNQRVLIVGGANSGIDIANHLINRKRYASLTVSMRSGTHLLPTYLAGLPVHLFGPVLSTLPLAWQDYLSRLMAKICFGDLSQYGVKTPVPGLATRLKESRIAPGFDQGFVKALKQGDLKVVNDIEHIHKAEVIFKNGEQQTFDRIICATGYRTGLSKILPKECIGPNETFNDLPGLWVFGMTPKLEGSLYARVLEAKRLAKQIASSLVLTRTA